MDEENRHDDSWLPLLLALCAFGNLYNSDMTYIANTKPPEPYDICQAKQEDIDALMLRNAQRSVNISAITKGCNHTFGADLAQKSDQTVRIDHDRIVSMLRYIRNTKDVDPDAYDDRDLFSGVGGDIDD